ncbi:hypothetical protein GCM10010404_17740 [Nonomuraea africana]|uniref:TRAP-type uncharacterized transport system fused permease subunit n=1 Tax=Nonomuraea africana TaxID=46171 RepID=A0ABR9KM63_9ACTN|nr:hypothetical protein [Nonomuraea africana]MBE1562890.1 TRAP-type uncharacterized transport system fused permease subunit [Nonomuraea africana]
MSSHLRHVRHLLDEGRFPWAHSYVDRLIADAPGDPEPLLLKALVLDHQGRPFEEPARRAAALGGHYTPLLERPAPAPAWRDTPGAWVFVFVLLTSVFEVVGEHVTGLDDLPWGGAPGVLLAVGACVGCWAALIKRKRQSPVEVARGRIAWARAVYAGLDDRNLRFRAGLASLGLFVVPVLASVGPEMIPFVAPALSEIVWTALLCAAGAALAWLSMCAALLRALRVSWVVRVNVVLAGALLAAPVWALGAWLLTLPWVIMLGVGLRREGALQRRPR